MPKLLFLVPLNSEENAIEEKYYNELSDNFKCFLQVIEFLWGFCYAHCNIINLVAGDKHYIVQEQCQRHSIISDVPIFTHEKYFTVCR